jgi:hypothetical protein
MLSVANKPIMLIVIMLSVLAPSRVLYSCCMGYKHIPQIKIFYDFQGQKFNDSGVVAISNELIELPIFLLRPLTELTFTTGQGSICYQLVFL